MKIQTNYLCSFKDFLKNNISLLFCILSAITAVTICSKSSPIYPFNDWVDSNCYFTVGKSIFKGLVPYRDLVEQKGPFIYFIHAFASLISYKSFLGVYFFELIGAFIFLYFSNKTLELFCDKNSYLLIPFFSLIVYTSTAFCHGDSAEELCFPFLSYLIYIVFKSIQTKLEIKKSEFLIIGIAAACVFWTKFTLCGIFVGWYIPFVFSSIKHKRFNSLFNSLIYISCGLLIGTLPYFIYFGINHSITHLFKIYIYNNIFLYTEITPNDNSFYSILKNLFQSLIYGLKDIKQYFSKGFILLIIWGIYSYLRRWKIQIVYSFSMFFCAFFFIFIGGRHSIYYCLGLAPIFCLGLIPVFLVLSSDNNTNRLFHRSSYLIYILVFFSFFYFTNNKYMLKIKKDTLPQYKFAKIISKTPNATLLNYGKLDIGLYTTAGIIPNCKYFCQLNIPLQEMYDTQKLFIQKGLCDYIVTYDENDNEIKEIDNQNLYVLVETIPFFFEGNIRNYSLYKLIDK